MFFLTSYIHRPFIRHCRAQPFIRLRVPAVFLDGLKNKIEHDEINRKYRKREGISKKVQGESRLPPNPLNNGNFTNFGKFP